MRITDTIPAGTTVQKESPDGAILFEETLDKARKGHFVNEIVFFADDGDIFYITGEA